MNVGSHEVVKESGVPTPKCSIVIPYKARLRNVQLAFEALAGQTLPRQEFEVVLGVMEHSPEFTALCQEYADRLDIVTVGCSFDWQVGRARNLALQMARGEVIVLLDVDMVVPPHFLANLWERHFADGATVCVVGQMLDYDNNNTDVGTGEPQAYAHYRELLSRLEVQGPGKADPRLRTEHVIPWSFAWTALIALPRAAVLRHGLFFDLNFHGYGVEDLEWAYRVARSGIPVRMAEDVFGIHLPHPRNVAANRDTEQVNYRYFLNKWPDVDVELAVAFGDFEANGEARKLRGELARVLPEGTGPAVVRGRLSGVDTVVIGAYLEAGGKLVLPAGLTFDDGVEPDVLPLCGLALPWTTGSVQRCVVAPTLDGLDARYRATIGKEAARVQGGLEDPARDTVPAGTAGGR